MELKNFQMRDGYVLVVGDVILDRYWSGSTRRISPEAPVPVVLVQECLERPGGAGNVALNVVSLGAAVCLLGVTGTDDAGDTLVRALDCSGVRCELIRLSGAPTVAKLRVLSQHQQLLRLDFESGFPGLDPDAFAERYEKLLQAARVVVLSDYAKGTLLDAPRLIQLARTRGIPVIVDPKGKECERYRRASLMTPNLREFEALVGPCAGEEELVHKAHALALEYEWDALLVTRGEQGMTLVDVRGEVTHFRAEAREVYDVTGAGDTVVAVLATCLASGYKLTTATAIANSAAGLVVGKLGAATVSPAELDAVLTRKRGTPATVVDERGLGQAVADARLRGERIVMTNGCFDILHAGHVSYLEQARALGDRLIVAVNDDASVRRLKGSDRPVNPLSRRLAVLAALKAVDWVIAFTADTPQDLICAVQPDVLVKGGDYQLDAIAGADCVRAAGGEVITIPLVPDCSTTAIIQALQQAQHPAASAL